MPFYFHSENLYSCNPCSKRWTQDEGRDKPTRIEPEDIDPTIPKFCGWCRTYLNNVTNHALLQTWVSKRRVNWDKILAAGVVPAFKCFNCEQLDIKSSSATCRCGVQVCKNCLRTLSCCSRASVCSPCAKKTKCGVYMCKKHSPCTCAYCEKILATVVSDQKLNGYGRRSDDNYNFSSDSDE